MIKIINEAFKNLPSWLKPYMKKGITGALDKHGIDLYNATYTDASDITPRDPRWRTGGILVALIQDPDSPRKDNEFYMWGYDQPEADPYMWDGKRASQHSKSWIVNNAVKLGFITKNQKPKKDRYQDPRKEYTRSAGKQGRYAGQTYHEPWKHVNGDTEPGYWSTGHGRDKSGYVIPNPAKLVGKLYEFDLDNAAKVLDNYYKKVTRIKNQIFNLEFRGKDDGGWGSSYSNLVRRFGDIARYFVSLEKEVNRLLQDSQSKDWDAYFAKYPDMTKDEWFKDRLAWLPDKKNLDDSLYDIQSDLKEFNS